MIDPRLEKIVSLQLLTSLGISPDMMEGSIDDIVDTLIERLQKWDNSYAEGFPEVDDSVYDTIRAIVKEFSPDNPYFDTLYSKDIEDVDPDLDRYISVKRMMSINTVRSFKDLEEFEDNIGNLGETKCNLSAKLNGHGVRVVLDNGDVVRATTRGRSKLGRDITEHMRKIIGHLEALEGYGLLEIRGEIVLSKNNFAKARQFNPTIKSVFTGVSSLIKPSASNAELCLLDFLGYYVLSDEVDFTSLSDMLYFIQTIGLKTPWFLGNGINLSGVTPNGEEESLTIGSDSSTFRGEINEILEYAEEQLEGYPYDTDGLVLSIDDLSVFSTMGNTSTHALGNVALKMGKWKQSVYSSIIRDIKLTPGKSKKSPVAIIEPVRADNGSTVRNVPLYNLATLVLLNAYVGHPIYFKYGGESGVLPCTSTGDKVMFAPDLGNLVSDDAYNSTEDDEYEEITLQDSDYSDFEETIDNDEYEDDTYDEDEY